MDWNELLRDTWQTSLVFVSLLVFTRLLGKTQMGELTFYEYVSGITIGSLAGNIAASDADKVLSHYYDLVLFVFLTYMVSIVTIKSRPLRKLIEGTPTIVIENGKIIPKNMGGMRYDLDELTCQLRQKGILDISEVQFGILETTGELSVIKKSEHQPVTKGDLNTAKPNPLFPIELIMDGEIVEENLKKYNITLNWVNDKLTEQGINDTTEVSYAVIDSKGKFYAVKYTSADIYKHQAKEN